MEIKKIIKKYIAVLSIAAIVITMAILGISHALFKSSNENTNNQVITTTDLDVTFNSDGSAITGDILPVTDIEGLAQDGYNVRLNNNINYDIKYNITLYNNEPSNFTEELVDHDYVKVSVNDGPVLSLSSFPYQVVDGKNIYDIYNNIVESGNEFVDNVKIWIDNDIPVTEDGKYLYLQMKIVSEIVDLTFADTILADNPEIKTLPNINASASTNTESGLYSSDDTNNDLPTYYFRGDVNNNYVTFANNTYRIVRINEDQSVRLVLNGIISEANEPYTNIDSILTNWYNTNLYGYSYKLIKNNYCKPNIANTTYIPTFTCQNNNLKNIGLLTYDEAVFAGFYPHQSDSNYLAINENYWLMNQMDSDNAWYISNTNNLENDLTTATSGIRPVINLKKATFVTGNGTVSDPYIVQ